MKPHVSVRIGELSVFSGLFVLGLYVLVQTGRVEEMHSEFLGLFLPAGLLGGF